jgi:two-component system response regulator RegA
MTLQRLLIVDDDEVFRERLARALRARGYTVQTAASVADALAWLEAEMPDGMVVDLRMPGESGMALITHVKAMGAATHILVLTGYGSIATAVEAMRLGAMGYLTKPADAEEILRALEGQTAPPALPETLSTPSLARAEWEHMQRILADCAGNVSEAARRLGIHRRSLQRKLQKVPPQR